MTREQFLALVKAEADPLFFVKEILGVEKVYDYQSEILNSVLRNKKTAWRSGHGVGKSAVASWATLWFLYTHPESKVITTASVWRQLSKMLWPEIHLWLKHSRLELIGVPEHEQLDRMIKIDQDWFATAESSDDPAKMEGFHAPYLLYVVDEGKTVPPDTYEAIEGAMTTNSKILVISTPPPVKAGYFWEIFSGKRLGFQTFHTSCIDSPLVSREWIEERKKEWGESSPMYQTRVLGEFSESSLDMLIPLSTIEKAQEVELEFAESDQIEIGIDVARFGNAKTSFVARRGPKTLFIESYQGWDTMQTAGHAVDLIRRLNPHLVKVDVIGLGAGVVDRLKEQGFEQVVGVNSANSASDGPTSEGVKKENSNKERFKNLRAQIWWGLRERFLAGNISIPENESLTAQLANVRHRYTSAGQIQIEEKAEMQKRGLASPDEADALGLAFLPEEFLDRTEFAYGFA